MDLFSFSRLTLYQSCPRRFYYKYVLELDDPAGFPAILGKTSHKAIELCYNGYFFEDAIVTAWLEESDMTVEADELRSLVQTALSYGLNGIPEKHFVLPLAQGINFQGYIDLLDYNREIPLIVDWKTGWNQYKVMDTWQLPLYAAAVMEETGAQMVQGMLAFLRFNRTESAVITRETASQAKAWAVRTAEEVQLRLDLLSGLEAREAFPSSPSPACRHCPWSYECLSWDLNARLSA